jgi:serine/threonine-protein kinase
MVGQTIGHYRVLRQIGVGGMGEVYAAEDLTLNREVALKLLPAKMADDAERRERFEREAKVIAALDHPNIVTIHSIERAVGADGEVHFITMQLVAGKTLGDLIPAGGFSVDRFFELAIPLAEAVSVAHENGITHRDLKPGNIMVAEAGRL